MSYYGKWFKDFFSENNKMDCKLCEYSTKLKADWRKHIQTKYHIKCVELENMRKCHETEIADMRKCPKYDSIDDVRTVFYLNSMFLNETKKEYELQDFGKWIFRNRLVCKSIPNTNKNLII
jgi:hypothetical protein